MSGKRTILLVDDNRDILSTTKQWLAMCGYEVLTANDARSAREIFTSPDSPRLDLVVLDILLPDGNGLDLCREIRAISDIPVLFLTSLGENDDIVAGFRNGGDDYLTKPFDLNVLEARIEAILRRIRSVPASELSAGNLRLNLASCRAFFGDTDILLTPKEFSILKLFVQNPDRGIQVGEIYRTVWVMEPIDDFHAVNQHIYCIRKKLSQYEEIGIEIESERNTGYRMTVKAPRRSRKNDLRRL
ncbi:MAG: response regulator transcription factor [Synergistaceae bacterium]|nr:response regulator transcription factor [Synergistaceae bacterium]